MKERKVLLIYKAEALFFPPFIVLVQRNGTHKRQRPKPRILIYACNNKRASDHVESGNRADHNNDVIIHIAKLKNNVIVILDCIELLFIEV